MSPVKINREKLLDVLRANRDNHRKIFLEAQHGYRAKAIQELDAMLHEARDNKRIRRSLSLIEPIDQTREYTRAITMLEMSVEDEITLSDLDFRQLVMDEWSWKGQFLTANRAYSVSAQDELSKGESYAE